MDPFEGRTMMRSSEVMELLRISRITLGNWMSMQNGIPYYRPAGKTAVFDRDEVIAWWMSQKKNGTPTTAHPLATPPDTSGMNPYQREIADQQYKEFMMLHPPLPKPEPAKPTEHISGLAYAERMALARLAGREEAKRIIAECRAAAEAEGDAAPTTVREKILRKFKTA